MKKPEDVDIDIYGWQTAERLVDQDMVENWKKFAAEQKPVRPQPLPLMYLYDGDFDVYYEANLSWWTRFKRRWKRRLRIR